MQMEGLPSDFLKRCDNYINNLSQFSDEQKIQEFEKIIVEAEKIFSSLPFSQDHIQVFSFSTENFTKAFI